MKSRPLLILAAVVALIGIALWVGRNHLGATAHDKIDKKAPATDNKHTTPSSQKPAKVARTIEAVAKSEPIANDSAPSVPATPEPTKYENPEIGLGYTNFIHFNLTTRLRGIQLTSDQCKELQDVYSTAVHARLQNELSILTATKTSERETEIEIPSYPAFGQKLKDLYLSSFTDILGTELASKVIDRLGGSMDGHNCFWGESPQRIHITYVPETKEYRISHAINPDGSTTGKKLYMQTTAQEADLDTYTKFAPFFPKAE